MSEAETIRPETNAARPSRRGLYHAFLALLLLAPLPLGANRPGPAALLAVAAGLLLLWWAVRAWARPETAAALSRAPAAGFALYGLVCLWVLLQYLPVWPAPLAHPLWAEASQILGRELPGRLTVNPEATLAGLMRLLTYGAACWLAIQLFRRRDGSARRAVRLIAYGAGLYALYGIAVYLAGNDWILWYRKWAYTESLTSTFVNRNSFATFAGLGLLCALSELIEATRWIGQTKQPLRRRAALFIEQMLTRHWALAASAAALAIALMLTGSRAGIVASFAGAGLLCAMQLRLYAKGWRSLAIAAGFAAVLAAGLLGIAGDLFSERMTRSDAALEDNMRSDVFVMVSDAIKASPWTGVGLGSFPDIFPAYRTGDLSSRGLWDKAHNSYLENALELGIPAALALHLAIAFGLVAAMGNLRSRGDRRRFAILGLSASLLVGLHALVDFSLQMPAIALLYAALLGLAAASPGRATARS
jgi:O-antigen ligase